MFLSANMLEAYETITYRRLIVVHKNRSDGYVVVVRSQFLVFLSFCF